MSWLWAARLAVVVLTARCRVVGLAGVVRAMRLLAMGPAPAVPMSRVWAAQLATAGLVALCRVKGLAGVVPAVRLLAVGLA